MVEQGPSLNNDVNTTSNIFENYKTASENYSVDVNVIKNLYNTMQLSVCFRAISIKRFHKLTTETADLYIAECSWYESGSISKLVYILREGDSEICIAAHKVSFL